MKKQMRDINPGDHVWLYDHQLERETLQHIDASYKANSRYNTWVLEYDGHNMTALATKEYEVV